MSATGFRTPLNLMQRKSYNVLSECDVVNCVNEVKQFLAVLLVCSPSSNTLEPKACNAEQRRNILILRCLKISYSVEKPTVVY